MFFFVVNYYVGDFGYKIGTVAIFFFCFDFYFILNTLTIAIDGVEISSFK